jgi:hypothetical protein
MVHGSRFLVSGSPTLRFSAFALAEARAVALRFSALRRGRTPPFVFSAKSAASTLFSAKSAASTLFSAKGAASNQPGATPQVRALFQDLKRAESPNQLRRDPMTPGFQPSRSIFAALTWGVAPGWYGSRPWR